MKKIVTFIIAVLSVLACSLFIAACSSSDTQPGSGGGTKPPSDPTVHKHSYVAQVVEAECTSGGYTLNVCECGANYIDGYTKALGHDMENDVCKRCDARPTEGLAYASANDGYEVSGIGTATASDIIIPSEYQGRAVVSVGDNAFKYNNKIEYVTLSESVKKVGREAFYGCSALKGIWLGAIEELGTLSLCSKGISEIRLPDTLKTIGSSVFSSLEMDSIHIPASVESIGARAFSGCDFETITVDPANTHYRSVDNCVIGPVTDNDGTRTVLLFGCKNSRIPDDGSFSEIYDAAFAGVVGLDELVIPDSIEKIGAGVFADSDMRRLKIGKGLNSISYGVFLNCENLVEITVDAQNEKYTAAGNCLIEKEKKAVVLGCKGSVIPTDPNIVTAIAANAFRECPVPESFVIPANVTSIGGYAFAYSNLKSATVYGTLENAESAFASCTSLKNVTIESGVTKIAKSMFANTSVEHVSLPDTVTEIGEKAFLASALTEIEIPSGVNVIPNGAFDSCIALTQVVIPNGVTAIEEYAFANCYNLIKVTLGTSVAEIGDYAFNNCNKLTELVNLSGLDIQKRTSSAPTVFGNIGYALQTKKHQASSGIQCYFEGDLYTTADYTSKLDFADGFVFYNNEGAWELYACSLNGDVILPTSYNGNDYDIASGAFAYYTSASSITVTGGVKSFKTYSVCINRSLVGIKSSGAEIEQQAILNCVYLKNVEISDCENIPAYGIYNCEALESIDFHNVENISGYAVCGYDGTNWSTFENVKRLTVTGNCDYVDEYAFMSFGNQDTVVILSKDIKQIKCYAFYNCGFDTVYFTGTRDDWQSMNIEYADEEYASYNALNSVEVYCYSESAPSGEGNYWHYADDGITPVKW